MNRVSAKLAARLSTRQLDALAHCDGAGDRADLAVTRQWDRLMRLLEREGKRRETSFAPSHEFMRQAAEVIREMGRLAHSSLHGDLTRIAALGHQSGAAALVNTLPVEYLKGVAIDRGHRNRPAYMRVVENNSGRSAPASWRSRALTEDDTRPADPGAIALRLGIGGTLQPTDRAGRLREPVRSQLSDAEQRELFQQLLFPPLSFDRIVSILRHPIAGKTWEQDLGDATRLADAHVLLGIISGGFSAGKTPQQVAMTLRPAVQGVKSTAKRVARTYGMQIAHRAQMDAHAELGDMLVGWQVHALLDQWTRPWHSHRSGTVYYLNPEPGQKGPEQMPHPPLEANDSNERPPGTPHVAYNCRCFLTPVLRSEESIRTHPDFQNADEKLIPDPATYSAWFDTADEPRRKLAVGARRYAEMQNTLGGPDVLTASLAGGRPVEFTPHESAGKSEVMMFVNPHRIRPDFAGKEVPGRRDEFRRFLDTGQPVQTPRVTLGADGQLDFIDGRHRTAELIAQGANRIAVSVPAKQAKEFAAQFGAEPTKGARRRPSWEHFVDHETGALLSTTHLRTESAEARAERIAKVRAAIAERERLTRDVARYGFVPEPPKVSPVMRDRRRKGR